MAEDDKMHALELDVQFLKQGQSHIVSSLDAMSNKLDRVGDALVSLIRLTEKHDALVDRVKTIEDRNEKADSVVTRGNAFMFAASFGVPILLGVVAWIFNAQIVQGERLDSLKSVVTKIEAQHENHSK